MDGKDQQQAKLIVDGEETEIMKLATAVADGDASNDVEVQSEEIAPAVPAKFKQEVLLEHAIDRAMATLRASLAPSNASNPLATVMQKLALAPETNVSALLYGPSYLYSAPTENFVLTPHHRPLTPSQMAEEARATERRHRLLSKSINIAPQELSAFRAYCEDTARSMYGTPEQRKRFAAALKKLSDPSACMALAEAEMADEASDAPMARLVVVPQGAGLSVVLDTHPAAEATRTATMAARDQKTISSKLLSRVEADGALLVASKSRDQLDRQIIVLLDKFFLKGPSALSTTEQPLVVRALTRQLDEEETMFEAVERQEMSVKDVVPHTLKDLQFMKEQLSKRFELDLDVPQIDAAEVVDWSGKVLAAPPAVFEAIRDSIVTIHTAARSEYDAEVSLTGTSPSDAAKVASAEQISLAQTTKDGAFERLATVANKELALSSTTAQAFAIQLVLAAVAHVVDLRSVVEFIHVSNKRLVAQLPVLPISATHWVAVGTGKTDSADHLGPSDPRLVTAMTLWAKEQGATTPFYLPFHPVRRRIISLRHQLTLAESDAAKLALFHARHVSAAAEISQAITVRMQDVDAIREHATLDYLQKTYRPSGGYISPQRDDWDEQLDRLKEQNKYTATKKGGGKRGKKK